MIRKRIPEQVWDYGLGWVSETSSLIYTTAGRDLVGGIPLEKVTGETPDTSFYLSWMQHQAIDLVQMG